MIIYEGSIFIFFLFLKKIAVFQYGLHAMAICVSKILLQKQLSPYWASIKNMNAFMTVSTKFIINAGTTVRFWQDNWHGTILSQQFEVLYTYAINTEHTVKEAQNLGWWEISFRYPLSQEAQFQKAQLFNQIPDVTLNEEQYDVPNWKWIITGQYTVRSYYDVIKKGPHIISPLQGIWRLRLPKRMTIFAWLMLQNKLHTTDNLTRRGWNVVSICYLCRQQAESVDHMFGCYGFTQQVRQSIKSTYRGKLSQDFTHQSYATDILYDGDKFQKIIQITMCFVIWRERCSRIFREVSQTTDYIHLEVIQELARWFNIDTGD
jgi:zinc-binding in reverse transcriptase